MITFFEEWLEYSEVAKKTHKAMTDTTTKPVLDVSHVINLAAHVTDTGGFCLCLGVDSKGDTWRLAVLPGNEYPYAVQIQHIRTEKGKRRDWWGEWEAFIHLQDAAALFCHVVNK